MKKTELLWDKYIEYLIKTINDSNYMKRAENKPMMTPRLDIESHLTSRATHLRQAAEIARNIAKKMGLNENLAYVGMLMHDAGHPFSAHEGEVIFEGINEYYNGTYFHHNAVGIDIILNEDICEKAISMIPGIDEDTKEKLREEFYYFLDVVISHDGEATIKDITKKGKKYSNIKEAVDNKSLLANSINKYKFTAQTPEGQVAKYADVIAYISSDIQDAFRLGFLTELDEEYLEMLGTILDPEPIRDETGRIIEKTREEKIRIAKAEIDKIQTTKIMNQVKDVNQNILAIAISIKKQIEAEMKKNPKLSNKKIDKIISKKIEEYGLQQEGKKAREFIQTDKEKIETYVKKLLNISTEVVAEITGRMQNFFINNLINNNEGEMPQLSEKGLKMISNVKKMNLDHFVIKIKLNYQNEKLPTAAIYLVKKVTRMLLRTGIIQRKFYDEDIRKELEDCPEILEALNISRDSVAKTARAKKRIGLRTFSNGNNLYATTGKGKLTENRGMAIQKLTKKIYENIEEEGETFTRRCKFTYYAIFSRIEEKVDIALKLKERKESSLSIDNEIKKQYAEIQKRFMRQYKKVTHENIEKFKKELIAEEMKRFEEKVAVESTVFYLAGMTDRSFIDICRKVGVIDQNIYENAKRGAESESARTFAQKLGNEGEEGATR